ncbi:hypothetical protein P0D73_19760 [Paraburkholderia sp. RL18-101-BIB-B]|uniref:hypothetical protein n=1 Tax=Paraburkholderia sp. RL18-101-BIB-B TaxID=3031634 RepID=UPI0038BC0FCE
MQPVHVFPFTLFIYAWLLNFAFWCLPWCGRFISHACKLMTSSYSQTWVNTAISNEKTAKRVVSEEDNKHLRELVGQALAPTEHSMGRVVALIEETLYLYSAFAQIESIFSGVLLFKAFHTWISSYRLHVVPSTSVASTYSLHVRKLYARFADSRSYMLVKFYEYAIGNFISLGSALFFYLLVIKVAYHCPQLGNWTNYWYGFEMSKLCMLDPGRNLP